MKFLIVVLAFVALAAADVSHLAQADGYHNDAPAHHEEHHHHEEVAAIPAAPAPEYLPPAQEHHEEHHHEEVAPAPVPAPAPAPAPAPEYLPPQSEEIAAEPIAEPESAALGDNGYEYRTVKRYRYRVRY